MSDTDIVLLLDISDKESPDSSSSDSEGEIPYSSSSESNSDLSDAECERAEVWTDVSKGDSGPPKTVPLHNIYHGPVLPTSFVVETPPVEYFSLFFDDDILQYILTETNIQGDKRKMQATPTSRRSRMRDWHHATLSNMKAFIGMIINMGLHPLPDIKDYFGRAWVDKMPFFGDVFPRDEFLLLFWNLHFAHAEENKPLKKGEHIKVFAEKIREKCMLFYQPGAAVSVDESTISFKGRVSFKVYNPNKPTKFGLKVFALSDSANGYLYNFIPYMGKTNNDTSLLKTTLIVKTLCSALIKDVNAPPSGYHIYTDRYYTSPELASELSHMNMVTTGTVMPSRKGMPEMLKTCNVKKMKKGDLKSFRKNETVALAWKDKRVVTMLSTHHKGDERAVTDVPSKYPNQPPVSKPDMIIDYTKHMGGVDRTDQYTAAYPFLRRSHKWYRKMFFWLIEVCIVNSFLLYSMVQQSNGKNPISHKNFRKSLVEALVEERMSTRKAFQARPKQILGGPSNERLNGMPHFIDRSGVKSLACVVCRAQGQRKCTIYFCETCTQKPYLHPDKCFKTYHTQEKF